MKKLFLTLVLGVMASLLWAQSNDYIDQLLEVPEANVAQALYIALTSSDQLDPSYDEASAVAYARENGWPLGADLQVPATIGEYAFFLAKAFKINGGLMYGIFPGPRYAMRELISRRVVSGKPDIGRKISGEEVLRLAGNMVAWRDGQ